MNEIKFRDGEEVLTLYPEKTVVAVDADPSALYIVGWCPEKQNTFVIHPANVIEEVKA